MGIETHLVHYILQRVWAVNGKANEEEVGLRVGQWPESIVLFLSRCVPEG